MAIGWNRQTIKDAIASRRKHVLMGALYMGRWAVWAIALGLLIVFILCIWQCCGWTQTAELIPVTEAKPVDASKALMKLTPLSGVYDPTKAQVVVDATMIAAAEAANAKLEPEDRKPLVIKTDTDQWPYRTYFKAEQDCRMTNETFGGLIETKATAQLRIYPDGKLADYVDAKKGDIIQIVPVEQKVIPNDSGPRPVIIMVVPVR